MNKIAQLVSVFALGLTVSMMAHGHRAWIKPSATVLSGEDAWVTFDAAVSNDIFHVNHVPLGYQRLTAIGPDGKSVELHNAATGKYRSTFDVNLSQSGTYKVFYASSGLNARWETEGGERRFWPPRGVAPTPEGFEKEVPKKAKNLQISQSSHRIETFVTAGSPSDTVLKPTKVGLEMVPVTHPNDLFAGETAEFIFLMDGKPAVGAKVTAIPGGMRYRNEQAGIEVVTDKKGKASITWPDAGMYWLNAEYSDDKGKKPAKQRRGAYVATLEVLPE